LGLAVGLFLKVWETGKTVDFSWTRGICRQVSN